MAFTLIVELNVFAGYASLNPNTNRLRTFLFIYSYNVGIMKYSLLLTFKESVTRLNITIDNTEPTITLCFPIKVINTGYCIFPTIIRVKNGQ